MTEQRKQGGKSCTHFNGQMAEGKQFIFDSKGGAGSMNNYDSRAQATEDLCCRLHKYMKLNKKDCIRPLAIGIFFNRYFPSDDCLQPLEEMAEMENYCEFPTPQPRVGMLGLQYVPPQFPEEIPTVYYGFPKPQPLDEISEFEYVPMPQSLEEALDILDTIPDELLSEFWKLCSVAWKHCLSADDFYEIERSAKCRLLSHVLWSIPNSVD